MAKVLSVWTRVTCDTGTYDYLDKDVDPEHALAMLEAVTKYEDECIDQIDNDEDRGMIMQSVMLPDYWDYFTLDQVKVMWVEETDTDTLRQLIVEKHNEQVEQTLTKLD